MKERTMNFRLTSLHRAAEGMKDRLFVKKNYFLIPSIRRETCMGFMSTSKVS